jgi:hypothetical protein
MATDRIRSLYAGLYRTVARFGLLIAAAWLFTVFSYYLSRKTGTDWFSRLGSVMALVGAAVTFRLANFYQRALATALDPMSQSIRCVPKHQRAEAQQVSDYSGPRSCSLRKRLVLVQACIIADLTCGKRMQPIVSVLLSTRTHKAKPGRI